VLHPVGPLPAAVYWRRRLLVSGLLAAVLGGGGWVGGAVLGGGGTPPTAAPAAVPTARAGAAAASGPVGRSGPVDPASAPALDRVVPALAAVTLPVVPDGRTPVPGETSSAAPAPAAPVDGGPCSDEMISVAVRPDGPSAAVGARPTFTLVVTDTSPVRCTRAVDPALQEIVLLDAAGNRVWGSEDCATGGGAAATRTFAPGESVTYPVRWSGRTSVPGCTAARVPPPAGAYVLRGRLDTRTGPDVPFTLT